MKKYDTDSYKKMKVLTMPDETAFVAHRKYLRCPSKVSLFGIKRTAITKHLGNINAPADKHSQFYCVNTYRQPLVGKGSADDTKTLAEL